MTTTDSDAVAGHVFVSYVREDSSRVDWLCQVLEAAGIRVWRDTAQLWPGEDWRAVIRRAIEGNALVFLACFSRHGVGQVRTYQNEEIVLAIDEMRLRPPDRTWLIPVRFDDCRIPDRDLGASRKFSDLRQADLFGPGRQQNAQLLVTAIRRALSPGAPAPARGPADADPSGVDPAAPAPAASSQTQLPKYVINIGSAEGVQIGDGAVQHNTFDRRR